MQEFSRNDIANFAKKITAEMTFRGAPHAITYRIGENMESDNWVVWANGCITIADEKICVGGGWIETDGSVEDYSRADMGEFAQLADALGIAQDDEDALDELYESLCESLPAEWPEAAIIV